MPVGIQEGGKKVSVQGGAFCEVIAYRIAYRAIAYREVKD